MESGCTQPDEVDDGAASASQSEGETEIDIGLTQAAPAPAVAPTVQITCEPSGVVVLEWRQGDGPKTAVFGRRPPPGTAQDPSRIYVDGAQTSADHMTLQIDSEGRVTLTAREPNAVRQRSLLWVCHTGNAEHESMPESSTGNLQGFEEVGLGRQKVPRPGTIFVVGAGRGEPGQTDNSGHRFLVKSCKFEHLRGNRSETSTAQRKMRGKGTGRAEPTLYPVNASQEQRHRMKAEDRIDRTFREAMDEARAAGEGELQDRMVEEAWRNKTNATASLQCTLDHEDHKRRRTDQAHSGQHQSRVNTAKRSRNQRPRRGSTVRRGERDASGKELCLDFHNHSNCHRGECRFSHDPPRA